MGDTNEEFDAVEVSNPFEGVTVADMDLEDQ